MENKARRQRTDSIIGPVLRVFESESRSVVSDSLQLYGLYSPWNSPGQNTGVGSLPLLQGIFPTQGSNPGLLYCRRTLYQLSHKGAWIMRAFAAPRATQPGWKWVGKASLKLSEGASKKSLRKEPFLKTNT